MSKNKGFSLIEIILVMAALIGLTALIFVGYQNVSGKQRARAEVEDIKHVISEIKSMYLRAPKIQTIPNDSYPSIFPKHMLVRESGQWRAFTRYGGRHPTAGGGIGRADVRFGNSTGGACGTASEPFCSTIVINWPISLGSNFEANFSKSECVALLTGIEPFTLQLLMYDAPIGGRTIKAPNSTYYTPAFVKQRISEVCGSPASSGFTKRYLLFIVVPL